MTEPEVRAVLERLTDPTYAADFDDVLSLLATAADEGEEPAVRAVSERGAADLLDDLAANLAVELAFTPDVSRQLVNA